MPTRDEYIAVLKDAVLTAGKRWVMEWIVSKIPFFGMSVPHAVVGWVVGKVLWIAIIKTELGAFFLFIDLRTSKQGREFYAMAVKNRDVQQNGSKEQKRETELQLINRARNLIKFAS